MKILVVDDNKTNRIIMNEMASKFGSVDLAEDGNDAIEKAKNAILKDEHYDLIFMDIAMPERDGKDAVKIIRWLEEVKGFTSKNTAKIVMTTAFDDKENVLESFKNQCEAYIVKPITLNSIKEALDKVGLLESEED